VPGFDPAACKLTLSKWLVSELTEAAARVTEAVEQFRFNDMGNELYSFIWGTYCDWYLELAKPVLAGDDAAAAAEIRALTAWSIDRLLHLLHPIMPFLTEELYEKFIGGKGMLIAEPWPQLPATLVDAKAQGEIGWLVRLISDIRAVRSEMNVPAGAVLPMLVREAGSETRGRLQRYEALIKRLARIGNIDAGSGTVPKGSVQLVLEEATFALPLADIIDFAAERARLKKEIGKLDGEISKIDGKLNNAAFVAKAPAEVVEEQRERREEALATKQRLGKALQQLAG